MFGSHLSIAGGMHNALLEAERLGMDTVQVFTTTCSFCIGRAIVFDPVARRLV
jgi:endonuclease IV